MASIEELLKRYPPRDIPVDPASASATAQGKIPVGQATELGGRPTPQAPRAAPAPATAAAQPAPAARIAPPKAIGTLGKAGGVLGAAYEGSKVYDVATNPNATTADVVAQADEGIGRLAGAGLGAAAGAKLSPALATVPVVGPGLAIAAPVAGAALGYYGAGKVMAKDREMQGLDGRAPVDRLASVGTQQAPAAGPAAATPVAPAPRNPNVTNEVMARTGVRPSQVAGGQGRRGIETMPGSSAQPQAATDNVITFDPKTNTYSGTNITEGATITGGLPGGRGTGRMGVSDLGGSSEARGQDALAAQRSFASADENESANAAATNQYTLMRAEQTANPFAEDTARRTRAMETQQLVQNGLLRRRDVGAYLNQEADRVDKRRSENQLARLRATEIGTDANVAMRGQDLTAQTVAARDLGDRAASTARDRTLLDISKLQTDARKTAAEQAAEARAAAAETAANRHMVVPTQEIVMTPDGPQSLQRSRVFNPATGKYVDLSGQQSTGVQITPKSEYDKMPKGAQYIGPDGKAYTKG